MLVDFVVETLTKGDGVFGTARRRGVLEVQAVEPEFHAIKKMKPRLVENRAGRTLSIRAKENARRKNALESLNDTPVANAILRQLKEVK
jgi:hypothetical protein